MYKPSPSHQQFLNIITEKNRNNRINFRTGGTYRDYILRGDKYKDLTFEEWLQEDKPGYKPSEFGRVDKAIGGGVIEGEDLGTREGFQEPKSSKVKTKEFPVERKFYNRRTGKMETLFFKGQESGKVATRLPINKIPQFKKLYRAQNTFKDMAKTLGVSYDVLKDLEEELIDKGEMTKRKLSRVPSFRNPVTGQIETKATIARAKKVTQMADFIEKEIEKFNKNKILPDEKYEVDYNKLKQKFNITKAETLTGFLNSVDAERDLDYIRPASSEKGTNRRTGLTDAQVSKYKKEYKSKPLNTLAQEMSGKGVKNKNTMRIRGALERLRNILIDKKLINVEDIATRASVPFDPTFKITSGDKAQYLQKQVNLAKLDPKGIVDDPKYFSQRGPFTGKFNPQTFDRELLKFLNMDTVAGSLDPKLFEKGQSKFLKPSFEHIQGVTPGDIIGDSKALRTVAIATKRYNFQEMGSTSNLYKDVKDYLRVAVAALKNNDKTLANDSVKIVNEVYDKVSERFPNLDRKDLPNYSIKGNNVKETNLKGLIKPQKLEDSFKQYFKSAADTIKPSELKIAERVQPNFAKVINLFKDGKINEGYNLIKSRIPSVKGGGKFAVPILAGGTAINFLTSPSEAEAATLQMPQGSPGQINPEKEKFDPEKADPTLATAVGTYGAYKYGPQVLKLLKKGAGSALRTVSSPTGATFFGLSEILDYKKPSEDASVFNRLDPRNYEVQEDPDVTMAGVSLLLPEIAKTAGLKSKILNPFNVGRAFTPLGIATILGSEGYKIYKQFQELEKLKREDPEAYEAFRKTRVADELSTPEDFAEIEDMGMVGAANGGLITRQAFKDGFDPKKRQTMKILGGLASIPVLGKYIKILGPLAPKVVETVERGSDAVPTFLYDLIAKVKEKGMKFFTGKSSDEFEYVYERDGYQVREQGNKITVRKRVDDGEMLDKDMEMELEVDPETGGLTYKEATARPDAEGKLKDVEEYIEDADLEEMKKYTYDE